MGHIKLNTDLMSKSKTATKELSLGRYYCPNPKKTDIIVLWKSSGTTKRSDFC